MQTVDTGIAYGNLCTDPMSFIFVRIAYNNLLTMFSKFVHRSVVYNYTGAGALGTDSEFNRKE